MSCWCYRDKTATCPDMTDWHSLCRCRILLNVPWKCHINAPMSHLWKCHALFKSNDYRMSHDQGITRPGGVTHPELVTSTTRGLTTHQRRFVSLFSTQNSKRIKSLSFFLIDKVGEKNEEHRWDMLFVNILALTFVRLLALVFVDILVFIKIYFLKRFVYGLLSRKHHTRKTG